MLPKLLNSPRGHLTRNVVTCPLVTTIFRLHKSSPTITPPCPCHTCIINRNTHHLRSILFTSGVKKHCICQDPRYKSQIFSPTQFCLGDRELVSYRLQHSRILRNTPVNVYQLSGKQRQVKSASLPLQKHILLNRVSRYIYVIFHYLCK